jgi:hypothetical protein
MFRSLARGEIDAVTRLVAASRDSSHSVAPLRGVVMSA